MISEKDLNRCIDILAELNAKDDGRNKKLLLEIGYILKTELNNVSAWNRSVEGQRQRGRGYENIDVKKLLEDNTQLFNENHKLQQLNLKLKEALDERIAEIERRIENTNSRIAEFNSTIEKLNY